jgi:transposase InsO family protein
MKFIAEVLKGDWEMTDLCTAFQVSRKTGYKWVGRYEAEGLDGLKDRSRAPHRHPNATPPEVVELLLEGRRKHPTWGPVKLMAWLDRHQPGTAWPAPSTAGDILKRHGLVQGRRRRRRAEPRTQPFAEARQPNDVWCADFKGWFRTRDGSKCEPLTISDAMSRFVLECRGVESIAGEVVKPVFEKAFREYGLPLVMRTDNGPPFASRGLAGLSRLSVWWIKLGIRPERITPGKPQENGRHERFHLTLKHDVVAKPRSSLRAQQRAFNEYRTEFNFERPHEALDNKTPSEAYVPSPRPYPSSLPVVEYPGHFEVRSVRHNGEMKWLGTNVYVTEALAGESVGLEQKSERHWTIFFGSVALGIMDSASKRVLRFRELKSARGEDEKT